MDLRLSLFLFDIRFGCDDNFCFSAYKTDKKQSIDKGQLQLGQTTFSSIK